MGAKGEVWIPWVVAVSFPGRVPSIWIPLETPVARLPVLDGDVLSFMVLPHCPTEAIERLHI